MNLLILNSNTNIFAINFTHSLCMQTLLGVVCKIQQLYTRISMFVVLIIIYRFVWKLNIVTKIEKKVE
jgi:hypothetical protein